MGNENDVKRIKEILMRQMELLANENEKVAIAPYDPENPKQLEYIASMIACVAKSYREYL